MTDLKIWSILIITWVIIASTYIAIKISIDTIPPILMSGIRYILSGLLLFFVYKLYSGNLFKNKTKFNEKQSESNRDKHGLLEIINKKQWKAAIIVGISLIVCGQGLLAYGEQYLTSNITALLFSTVPIWIILISKFHYKEKLNKYTVLGIILGSTGLAVLIYPSLEQIFFEDPNTKNDNQNNFLGIIILLIAAISWAFGSIYSNNANLPDNVLVSTGMFLLTGGIFLLFTSIAIGEFNNINFYEFSISSILSVLYLIIVGSLGWVGFYWILRNSTATLANTFAYVSPVIAVLLGWLILNESIDLRIIIATVVIIIGVVFLVNKHKIKK